MAPKRAASSDKKTAAKPAAPKVAKAAPKAGKAAKAEAEVEEQPATVLEAAGAAIKKAKRKVAEVVDNAGELLIDDVAPEAKAKAAPKAKGKVAKGKAAPKAGEDKVDVAAKAGAALKKAGKKVSEVVENVGDMIIDDVAPVEEEEKKTRGTKRKTAEEFMAEPAAKTEKKVKAAAGKKAEPKSKGKAKAAASVEEEEEEDASAGEESFIGAFESDDEMGGADSSDDESDVEDEAINQARKTVQVSTLPHAKDDKTVAARLKKASKKKNVERATIYLGRVPHGFYEDEIKEYFGQFGDVTRYRLARNPKSGASRHYGYVEFSSAPVAEIVAETMHNYLLMGHLLQCVVVPQDEVHPELWVGANKKWRKVPRARVEKMRQDKPRTAEQQARANARLLKKEEARREKIKAKGIDYEFEGH